MPDSLRELLDAWDAIQPRLQDAMPSASYDRWIRTLKPVEWDKEVVTLAAPSEFAREWVSRKFAADLIAPKLSDVLEIPVTVRIVVTKEADANNIIATQPPVPQKKPSTGVIRHPSFVERFTFDRFVQGNSNRLAFAGAQAVANEPGRKFNPLFIYGGNGLGKTHLLHAIGQHILARDPETRIVYLTGQVFVEGFVHSLKSGSIGEFRQMQRSVHVWLLDDVQFIAGKDRSQEELFHIFNWLYEAGRQIVLCSDRPPRELYRIEERLRSRFQCGLVADISPPDFETRAAILIKKAEEDGGVSLPMDVVELIAERIQSNVRNLEGALCRLLAECSLRGIEPSVPFAEEVLAGFFAEAGEEKPSPELLIEAAARHFGVSVQEVQGQGRKQPVSRARRIAMYLCRELWRLPWKQIGAIFGKDHSSAIYAHRSTGEELVQNPDLQRELGQIAELARSLKHR